MLFNNFLLISLPKKNVTFNQGDKVNVGNQFSQNLKKYIIISVRKPLLILSFYFFLSFIYILYLFIILRIQHDFVDEVD